MRKLLALASLALAAWWLLTRRRPEAVRATVGFADGSAVSPEPGSPEAQRLVEAAREAIEG